MATLNSKSGYSYNTDTGIRTNPDGSTTTINSDNLNAQTKINLPKDTPDTSINKLNTITNSYSGQQGIDYEAGIEEIKNKYGNTSEITNLMKEISGVEGTQSDIADSLGATENLKKYKKFTTDIQLLDENERQAIDKIMRENPTGALRGGQADLIKNIQRENANQRAILTIQRSAALGDYQTAIDTAKAKVEMELAPKKAELERLKFVQENNKDFQTAEINMLIKRKENEYNTQQKEKEKANEMIINAIQGKAPQSLISKAQDMYNQGKSSTEIAGVLGNYSLSMAERLENNIKQAQLNKLNQKAEEYTLTTLGKPINQEDKNKIETFSDIARLADELKTMKGKKAAVGKSFLLGYVPGTKAFGFKEKTEQLVNTLASGNLDKLKGAMSDKDILFLQKINTNLSTKLSEKDYEKEINRIYNTITGKLKDDYGIDYKVNMSDLSNEELVNVASENIDNATFFNNL